MNSVSGVVEVDGRGDGDASDKDVCVMVGRYNICRGEEGGGGSGSNA